MAEILDAVMAEFQEKIPRLKRVESYIPHYSYNDMEEYERWLTKTKRYLNIHHLNDKDIRFFIEKSKKRLCPDQQRQLLAMRKAFVDLPILIPQKDDSKVKETEKSINSTVNFSNSNSQSQNHGLSLAVNMFIDAIKDDLTGKLVKELKEVIEESTGDNEKARKGIMEKQKFLDLMWV